MWEMRCTCGKVYLIECLPVYILGQTYENWKKKEEQYSLIQNQGPDNFQGKSKEPNQ